MALRFAWSHRLPATAPLLLCGCACSVAVKGAGLCSSVDVVFPFLKSRMHVAENQEDSNQLVSAEGGAVDLASSCRVVGCCFVPPPPARTLLAVCAAACSRGPERPSSDGVHSVLPSCYEGNSEPGTGCLFNRAAIAVLCCQPSLMAPPARGRAVA